jgi:hypothetical protein
MIQFIARKGDLFSWCWLPPVLELAVVRMLTSGVAVL